MLCVSDFDFSLCYVFVILVYVIFVILSMLHVCDFSLCYVFVILVYVMCF